MTSPKPIPDASSELIDRLAKRVRAARLALGLPRRALSERSGVSQRYLAQLEAGEGNISVLLLHRVATALDVPIESLLSRTPPLEGDVARVAQLYAAAPSSVQGKVRAMLAPDNPLTQRAQRICLVGLRGAGKSTLGKAAAEKLKIPFIDLTDEIEAEAGMPLADIRALSGQDGYRSFEEKALDRVIRAHDKMILAVAGDIVADEDVYAKVLERFHTVWVRTSLGEYMGRVRAQGDQRRGDGNTIAMEQLRTLLSARTPYYERAHAQVDTSSKPVQASVNDLLAVIASNSFLGRIGRD